MSVLSRDAYGREWITVVAARLRGERPRFDADKARAIGAASIEALNRAGLSDAEIVDLSHAIAIFAWANRLMLTLGEPVVPQ